MNTSKEIPQEIIRFVEQHDSPKVKVAIADIDGIMRGKYIHKDKFLSAAEHGFGFCDVVFGWDQHDLSYDNCKYTGWHTGFPDAHACIDLKSFRQVPWDNKVPFFLADFKDSSGSPLAICPRNILKNICNKADSMGYKVFASQEYEWFNFIESPESFENKGFIQPETLTRGMFGYSILRATRNSDYFNDLFDLLNEFKVPLEGLHTETGPGVFEAAILYSDLLEAGDRSFLFKTAVKEIGMQHGIMPSFMAKFHDDYPGCSGHIHQSLWDKAGEKNLFFDESADTKMSSLMESYLAGQLRCLPELLPLYAPTINSYKRLVEGAWAPTTLTWGIDNRTTAIRALPGNMKSTRIEFRAAGSDMNPYLAMAASVASGLYGIEQNLKLDTPRCTENGYEDKSNGTLAKTLKHATELFRDSEIANQLLGEKFVQHFADSRDWEWQQFLNHVTDWELKRYFEII